MPRYSASDLLDAVPAITEVADVVPREVARVGGPSLTLAQVMTVMRAVTDAAAKGHDGIVITHGTDTIEETAYALALMVPRSLPIVLTGAMRAVGALSADGPANLVAATRVAALPAAGALGPVVVMQDEIHLARWVTKVHTARVAAFASPGFGPVGAIHEDRVRLWGLPDGEDYLGDVPDLHARVELITVGLGTDGLLVDSVVEKVDGLVIAGVGGGHVAPALAGSLERAVSRRVPVILASRTGSGPVLEDTYSGVGAERELLALGLRPAGLLTPVKARLRLIAALSGGIDPEIAFPALRDRPVPPTVADEVGLRD